MLVKITQLSFLPRRWRRHVSPKAGTSLPVKPTTLRHMPIEHSHLCAYQAASGVQLTENGVLSHIIVYPWLTSFISPAITWDSPPASLSVAMSNETRRYTSLCDSIKLKVVIEGRVCIPVKIDVCADIAV
jgi:hypothetical protein